VHQKDSEQTQAKHQHDQRMAMQLVGIALKHLAAHKDGGVAGSMSAEKKKEQQPGGRHDEFLADGGGEKSDKPHKRTLGKKL
jgi:hypothetical protein